MIPIHFGRRPEKGAHWWAYNAFSEAGWHLDTPRKTKLGKIIGVDR